MASVLHLRGRRWQAPGLAAVASTAPLEAACCCRSRWTSQDRELRNVGIGLQAIASTSRGSVLLSVSLSQPASSVALRGVGTSGRDGEVACSSCRRQCVPLMRTRRGMKSCNPGARLSGQHANPDLGHPLTLARDDCMQAGASEGSMQTLFWVICQSCHPWVPA